MKIFLKGCGNGNFQNFWLNPQYCITLGLNDGKNEKIGLIVSLFQCECVRFRDESNGKFNSIPGIGFSIYKVNETALDKVNADPVKFSQEDLTTIKMPSMYMGQREYTAKFYLESGTYVIIPATFKPDISEKFLLRLFTEIPYESEIKIDHKTINAPNAQNSENSVPDKSVDPVKQSEGSDPVKEPKISEVKPLDPAKQNDAHITQGNHSIVDEIKGTISRACSIQ